MSGAGWHRAHSLTCADLDGSGHLELDEWHCLCGALKAAFVESAGPAESFGKILTQAAHAERGATSRYRSITK